METLGKEVEVEEAEGGWQVSEEAKRGVPGKTKGRLEFFFTHLFLLLYSNYKTLSVFFVAGKFKKI